MKKYYIKVSEDNDRKKIKIVNEDDFENQEIINSLELTVIKERGESGRFYVNLNFFKGKETPEMKQRFNNVGCIPNLKLDYEAIIFQEDLRKIRKMFKIIQEIDPIPFEALLELRMHGFDFVCTAIQKPEVITKLAAKGEHKEALQHALNADAGGYPDALAVLAFHYHQNNDDKNYYNVLEHIPTTSLYHQHALELLFERLSIAPGVTTQKDEFSSVESTLKDSCQRGALDKATSEALLSLVQKQREMNKEIKELREFKRKVEKLKSSHTEISGAEQAGPTKKPKHTGGLFC